LRIFKCRREKMKVPVSEVRGNQGQGEVMRRAGGFKLFALVVFVCAQPGAAADRGMVSDRFQKGDFSLVRSGEAADIYFDELDHKVVAIAARDLGEDVFRVTGVRPALKSSEHDLSPQAVIAGTIGKCGLIRDLIERGKLDASSINGQWESFVLAVINDPLPKVERALVIAGSDRRGAAFGVYELSQRIGVSPWVWWADSAPAHKDELFIKRGFYRHGPPSVKYRGIFINDEDFGIQPWAARTHEPELGDIGPRTYARVFELLLRLKANHLWPAMHDVTRAFNYYPDNKKVADDYAIVMGSAHCEQMLRNNVDEWKRDGKGRWWYQFNRRNILRYWEDRVRENGRYENVYTLGMRALHDSPIHAFGTTRTIVSLYERIIADQRGLLEKHVDPDVTRVPQIFCPYNEVQYYYRRDLDLPDDVTIMWADDNHGYIRLLSSPEERMRSGGSGVYFHVSYWGPPHDYLWICSTPPALIWEEMRKAYDYDARRVWMLNVGDLKPMEMATEFFLQMAWDIDRWDRNAGQEYLEWFAGREFGKEHAKEIGRVLFDYCLLNFQRRPEHMGYNLALLSDTPLGDPDFSLWHYGDEAQKRTEAFDDLERRASEIYEELPPEKKDSYFQMVLYQVRGASMMNKKILYAHRSRAYAGQGRWIANQYAEQAGEAFEGIRRETDYYNLELARGKWNHMMDSSPKDFKVFDMPRTGSVKRGRPGLGVAVEGMERPLSKAVIESSLPWAAAGGRLPRFNKFTRRKYFIDVFSRGDEAVTWRAEPSQNWIVLSPDHGELTGQQRVWVDVDYGKALPPTGDAVMGVVRIHGGGAEYVAGVEVFNPADQEVAPGSFVQDNGVISINAESFHNARDAAHGGWRVISGLGRTGAAVGLFPVTMPSIGEDEISEKAPALEYPVHVFDGGDAKIMVQALPTHEIHEGRELKLAISLDQGAPMVVRFEQGSQMSSPAWWKNVLRATMPGETSMEIGRGPHLLKVWGLDPSVVIDKIIVDFGGLKDSCLGPDETRAKNN
jgi:hypothetical protein